MLKALVVEDEAALQMLYGQTLETAGFMVFRASNGNEAIAYLKDDLIPQLIILDIRMPESNGFQVVEYLKNYSDINNVHVVIISASSEYNNLVELLPSAEFILKPVVLPPLRQILNRF